MVIKFNSSGLNTPGPVTFQGLNIIVYMTGISPPVLTYKISVPVIGDTILQTGDFIITNNGSLVVYKVADYAANSGNNVINEIVRKAIGDDVVTDSIASILALPVAFTNIRKANIYNTILGAVSLCERGQVVIGRAQANNTPTNADYTQAVKDGLLVIFDTHIAKL